MNGTLLRNVLALGCAVLTASGQAAEPGKALPGWNAYIEALKPVGDHVLSTTRHPDNPQEQQETWSILLASLAQGQRAG